MIKIEIISENLGVLQLAFYYQVPANMYNPLSANPALTPASSNLSAQEIIDLKAGRIVEVFNSIAINNRTVNELRLDIEALWRDGIDLAKLNYKRDYSYTGRYLDDTGWH